MESHTSSHAPKQSMESSDIDTRKSVLECELCPALSRLEGFAKRKYASYRGLAQREDDKQEVYDPLATNFLRASQLVVQAVLRSTQKEMGRA